MRAEVGIRETQDKMRTALATGFGNPPTHELGEMQVSRSTPEKIQRSDAFVSSRLVCFKRCRMSIGTRERCCCMSFGEMMIVTPRRRAQVGAMETQTRGATVGA